MSSTPAGIARPPGPALRWGFRAGGVLVALIGVWFVLELRRAIPPPAPEVGNAATVLPVPKPLPEFRLTDDGGAPFSRDALAGHWSFLFFGYTHCPSICPLTLGAMRDLNAELRAGDPPFDDAQWVFVSVDPARDAPERLRAYVRQFDPGFRAAMGEAEELGRLTGALGVFHERTPGGTERHYDFDHSASLLLIDPDARLHAVFSPPIDPEAAGAAFRAIRRLAATP